MPRENDWGDRGSFGSGGQTGGYGEIDARRRNCHVRVRRFAGGHDQDGWRSGRAARCSRFTAGRPSVLAGSHGGDGRGVSAVRRCERLPPRKDEDATLPRNRGEDLPDGPVELRSVERRSAYCSWKGKRLPDDVELLVAMSGPRLLIPMAGSRGDMRAVVVGGSGIADVPGRVRSRWHDAPDRSREAHGSGRERRGMDEDGRVGTTRVVVGHPSRGG